MAFLTKREQLRGRLPVPRLCVVQNPFSTPRKRGRHRAMAHVLVRNWLRSRYRIRRMAHKLVSPLSKRPSHVTPVVNHPLDRIANCPTIACSAGYHCTTPSRPSSSSTSSYLKPRAHRISTPTTSNPSSTHTNPKSTQPSFRSKHARMRLSRRSFVACGATWPPP